MKRAKLDEIYDEKMRSCKKGDSMSEEEEIKRKFLRMYHEMLKESLPHTDETVMYVCDVNEPIPEIRDDYVKTKCTLCGREVWAIKTETKAKIVCIYCVEELIKAAKERNA